MKKIISMISAVLVTFALSSPITSIAKSAEFFTIGTGGPTGVYFQTGNAICKMLHKSAIAKEHGRKKGIDKAYRCTAPSTTIFPIQIIGISKLYVFLKYVLKLNATRYTIDKGSSKKEIILNIKQLLYQMLKNNLFKNLYIII